MLLGEPLVQVRRAIRLVPTVVSDAGVFRVLGLATDRTHGLDHVARLADRYDVVGRAVEAPAGDVLDLERLAGVPAATDGHDGGPALGILLGQAPGAEPAHG